MKKIKESTFELINQCIIDDENHNLIYHIEREELYAKKSPFTNGKEYFLQEIL